MTGVENTMILADQFVLGILTDGTELLVDISNRALDVGDRYDGVLIESKLLIGQLFEHRLACSQIFFHSFFGSLPLNDLGLQGCRSPLVALFYLRIECAR